MDELICTVCGSTVFGGEERCSSCGADPLLDGRYRLDSVLGTGAAGTTYRATRLQDGQVVAIKELSIRKMDSFKALELFEREALTLKALDHPGVPRYFEHLDETHGKHVSLYLVQEFIPGRTLGEIANEARMPLRAVLETALQVLGTLEYLHTLAPPVVHRDIKPSNLMIHPDGRVVLIDFGSVKAVKDDPDLGGSTVAGTFGFMAPEQFAGQARPASDIYGLAVTIVVVITGRSPSEMLDQQNELQWQRFLGESEQLEYILDRMLRRDPDERENDAAAVATMIRRYLQGIDVLPPTSLVAVERSDLAVRRPAGALAHRRGATSSVIVLFIGALMVFLGACLSSVLLL